MSAIVTPDVLELLDVIRRGGPHVFDVAVVTARNALDPARGVDLLKAAAWALYALELHDAAAGASRRRNARECAPEEPR